MARQQIFNRRRHRLLRPSVPTTETLASVAVGCGLLAVVAWVFGQRDAYDPANRDLDPQLLSRDGPKIQLYNPPLKLWEAPGSGTATAAAGPDLGPFPASLLDADWTLAGRVRAFDAANLYEKINGEAEKFIKQGFQSLHYAVLRRPDGTELAVELYDQGGLGGSLGIFSEHRPGERGVLERGGVTFFTTSVGVIGRIGRFFFRAAADRASPAVNAKALALVNALSTLVAGPEAAAAPQPLSRPTTAVAPDPQSVRSRTEAIAAVASAAPPPSGQAPAGPVPMRLLMRALQVGETAIAFEQENVFQLDFATHFWFATLSGTGRAFVHEAPSAAAATELLRALLEEQAYDYSTVREQPDGALLRHGFLKTYFAVRTHGRFLIGADNVPDEAGALATTATLATAVATLVSGKP